MNVLHIQVWSDIVCPWCYIGKRRLEEALDGFPTATTVTFRAFQLDPSPVPAGAPLKQSLAAKFGGMARAEQMFQHVTEVAATAGLTLDFDRAILANTFDAHRLIAWAHQQGRQLDLIEALQRAHFTDGADIGSLPTLATIASTIGLDAEAALAHLSDPSAAADEVRTDIAQAKEFGVTSVPTFVVDGRYAIQGAQEAATIRTALEEITRRETAA